MTQDISTQRSLPTAEYKVNDESQLPSLTYPDNIISQLTAG